MATDSIGWLPYGSDHPSVLCAHPLTSAPTNVTIPSTSVAELGTGTQTHDPIKGMLTGSSGGYKVTGLTNHDNCNTGGFQVTFEVERDWVTYSGNGSTGYDPASTEQFGLVYGFGGPTLCQKDTNMFLQSSLSGTSLDGEWKENGVTNNALNWNPTYHSAGKGDFVTINIGLIGHQNGGTLFMAVDGLILKSADTTYTANPVDYFNVFDIGKAGGGGITQHYIRNFQIASVPPTFPVIPYLSSVVFFGDSFNAIDTGGGTGALKHKLRAFPTMASAGNVVYDCHPLYEVKRYLNNRNLWIGDDYCLPYHGSRIDGLIDTAGIALCLTANPTGVVYSAGTNDAVAGRTAAQVSTSLQAHFASLFAGGVKWIVMPNIPSLQADSTYSASTYADNVDAVNAGIADAIATYTASNPTHIIKSPDVFTAFGGHSPNTGYFYTDDVHPSAEGCVVRGKLIGRSILEALHEF